MTSERYDTTGVIDHGKLRVRHRSKFEQAMRSMRDGDVIVSVRKARITRSDAQNRYYFGVVLKTLSEYTGHSVEELHEYCKERFNSKTLVLCDADGVIKDERRIAETTRTLTRLDFSSYCEAIRQWAAEDLGVAIPTAGEVG